MQALWTLETPNNKHFPLQPISTMTDYLMNTIYLLYIVFWYTHKVSRRTFTPWDAPFSLCGRDHFPVRRRRTTHPSGRVKSGLTHPRSEVIGVQTQNVLLTTSTLSKTISFSTLATFQKAQQKQWQHQDPATVLVVLVAV